MGSTKVICISPEDHYVHRVQFQHGIVALPCACGMPDCCGYSLVMNNLWQFREHSARYAPKDWSKERYQILWQDMLNSEVNYLPMFGGGFLGKQERLPFNNPLLD